MKKILYIGAIAVLALSSCSDSNQFSIAGVIDGANDEKLIIERSESGTWVVMDTILTDGSGNFDYSAEAPTSPAIYRLERKGQYAYIPIDSIDNILLTAKANDFATSYKLSGTPNAEWLTKVNATVTALATEQIGSPQYVKTKRELSNEILKNASSIVAYYAVEKEVNGVRIYSPYDAMDLKIIGAVATGFKTNNPSNPLTAYLENEFVAALRYQPRNASTADTIRAEQIGYLDIVLKDVKGNERKLSSVAKPGKVILLNFTTYLAKESPAFNILLNKIYSQFASRGLEIYQIGYDDDEFSWRSVAENLPWVTVYDPAGVNSSNLLQYNVGSLPAVFIINRNCEVAERVTDINNIESAVAKYM